MIISRAGNSNQCRAVFQRPKFNPYGFPPQWLEFLIEESLCLPEPEPWPHPGPDPKDAPFLALADRCEKPKASLKPRMH